MDLSAIELTSKTSFHKDTYHHLNLSIGTLECVYIAGHIADRLGGIELTHLARQLKGLPLVVAGPSAHHLGRVYYPDAVKGTVANGT